MVVGPERHLGYVNLVVNNLMSSVWCKNTENSVLQSAPMGNLLPIIFYFDGVSLVQISFTII